VRRQSCRRRAITGILVGCLSVFIYTSTFICNAFANVYFVVVLLYWRQPREIVTKWRQVNSQHYNGRCLWCVLELFRAFLQVLWALVGAVHCPCWQTRRRGCRCVAQFGDEVFFTPEALHFLCGCIRRCLWYTCIWRWYSRTLYDQPRGLVVRINGYWSWGPGFDSRFYHEDFSLKGKIPMVTMVSVV
jgi:hypothetical protein